LIAGLVVAVVITVQQISAALKSFGEAGLTWRYSPQFRRALAGCTPGAASNKLIAFREMRHGRCAHLEGNYDCI
jgi:hypothetical protein